MGFASRERAALCAALTAVEPDAPTLCEGWTAHDLAAHVWCRENDPLAAPGVVIGALADLTASRMEAVKRRWAYPELVRQIARGPRPVSPFALPALDEAGNTVEFFVHTEDVRRAGGLEPRKSDPAFEDHASRALATVARRLLRAAPVGVVFERTDSGERLRVRPGSSSVTVAGAPSELLLFAFGRVGHARVGLVGDPVDVASLLGNPARV